MEISVKNGIVKAVHKLKSNQIYKIAQSINYQSLTILRKPITCKGFSSRTEDNKEIICLDYDSVFYGVVLEDIEYLQKHYDLPSAYIFTTGEREEFGEKIGSYHVIILSKHSPKEVYEILSNTHIDKNYITSPLRNKYRSYILRLSSKNKKKRPKFLKLIEWNNNYYEISSAHKILLSKFYKNIKHPLYKHEDMLKTIKFQKYETFR